MLRRDEFRQGHRGGPPPWLHGLSRAPNRRIPLPSPVGRPPLPRGRPSQGRPTAPRRLAAPRVGGVELTRGPGWSVPFVASGLNCPEIARALRRLADDQEIVSWAPLTSFPAYGSTRPTTP